MLILLTNDDGIHAPGLQALTDIAQAFGGPDADIWTVAPAGEQSGVGHCISYTQSVRVQQTGAQSFALEGTPADCVLAAVHELLPRKPDLVLSGVNSGNNSAENALYSGTLGAAMEAALQDIPGIALSQYYGPKNKNLDDPFEASRAHLPRVISGIVAAGFGVKDGYRTFYNVNTPPCAAADVKGVLATPQGFRAGGSFTARKADAPNGRHYLWLSGGRQDRLTQPGTDAERNLAGYISVTPMRADLTQFDQLSSLALELEK